MKASVEQPILYVVPDKAECRETSRFLKRNGIAFVERDVIGNQQARSELEQKTGSCVVPTLDWNGQILSDFTLPHLIAFLKHQHVNLDVS